MDTVLPEEIAQFVRVMVPENDPVYRDLAAHNEERGFPTVGPEVGAALRVVARMIGAERVFEFGSGLGYSAYWVAPALPADGELVLTDFEESNLATAREFLERGGYADRAAFEAGDALESSTGTTAPSTWCSSTISRGSTSKPSSARAKSSPPAASSARTT